MRTRIHLGRVVATPGVLHLVSNDEVTLALARHASGDWGLVDTGDARANDEAVEHGGRILSAYETTAGVRYWILTEADRSMTTVLLPSEY
jgi:hypothetical protein